VTDGRREEQELGKNRSWREYTEESETEVERQSKRRKGMREPQEEEYR